MRTFVYVWVWFAFSILGFTFLPKAETFAVPQNSQSNFLITGNSEIFISKSSTLMAELKLLYIFLEDKIALLSPKVLGLSQIATYNPEIYRETSNNNSLEARIKFEAKIEQNGSVKKVANEGISPSDLKGVIYNDFGIENVEILSNNIIRLTFSLIPDPATIILPDRFSISGKSPHKVTLLDNGYQVDLHLSKNLNMGDIVNLHFNNIRFEQGIESPDICFSLLYTDEVSEVYSSHKNIIKIHHDRNLDLETLDASSFEMLDSKFSFQILSTSTPKVLHLKVSPDLEEGLLYHMVIPARTGADGKMISGSVRSVTLDTTPPQPVHFLRSGTHKILVDFDEAIDPVMAVVPQHYHINGQVPVEVTFTDKPNQVLLVMPDDEKDADIYELSIINVEDIHGNALTSTARIFSDLRMTGEPGYRGLVINEVMAAPRAGLTLPNTEYVELLNISNDEINISGYRLANSRSGTSIPAGTIIFPGEYLLLCPNARRGLLEPYGRVIGLTSWPTLLNNSDIVMLLDRENQVIDSLGYTRSNYGTTQIAQGGYSLEVVNPLSQCNLVSNLRPSTSPARGTPGAVNSVYDDTPDRSPPTLLDVTALGDRQVVAVFSKPISHNITNVKWIISPELNIVGTEFYNVAQTEILLSLDQPLSEYTRYTLQVTDIRDCAGNLIYPAGSTFTFALPMQAVEGDIVINEILFNPHTGTPKFVEIHNTSDKYINLRNWKLGNESGGMISNRRVISGNDLVMAPYTFRAITTDATMLIQMYPKAENLIEIGTLPSYPIREGTVFLLSPEEDIIERLDYHENLHHRLLRVPRGVSLERIDPSLLPNAPQNWTSAAGAAGYATPGFVNSQLFSSDNIGRGITVSPEVFAPETAGSQNYTTIQYQMDDPGYTGTIKIFDISGKLIKDIVQNEIWGSSGFYIWNGTDMNGHKVKVGYYIIWVELLNLEGKVINIKKTVVVGTKIR